MRSLAVIISFLVTFAAAAQGVDPKSVDKLMTNMLRTWQIPGAAVAIVRNDVVVFAKGYGIKEIGGTEPVTADTLFQLASTSKAFTSTSLAMLATDKKFSFDDPVKKYVPYFRLDDLCADSQVTVRDILSHRTGLTRHDELWDNSPLTREEVVRSIGQVGLTKPFRTAYQYQNIMFIAAGEVVTHASGVPWDDFVRTRIFQPLAMTRTITSDADWDKSDHATGHRYDWRTNTVTIQRPIDTHTLGAAGAIKSSARDMGNWIRFQLSGGAYDLHQLVDPDLLAETKTPQTVIRMEPSTRDSNPETNVMSYAMGWNVQDYRGELLIAHSGALNGFRAHVDLLPRRNSGFVVLINAGRGTALVAVRNALADMLSGKPPRDWNAYYLMIDRKADEKEAREKEERLAKRIPNTAPTLPLARYAGDYESPAYGPLSISVAGDQLVLKWSRMTIPLTHFHYDTFLADSPADDVDEQAVFTLTPQHDIQSVSLFGTTFVRK